MSTTRCLGEANGPATGLAAGTGSWRDGNVAAADGFGMFTCLPAFLDGFSSESSSKKKRGVAVLKN